MSRVRLALRRHLPIVLMWLAVAASEAAMPAGGFWTTDNAVRVIQVQNTLRTGPSHQSIEWPGREVDPEIAFAPFIPPVGHVVDGRLYVGFAPFYPMLVAPFYAALGMAGVRLVGLLFLLVLQLGVFALASLVAPPGRVRRVAPHLAVGLVTFATPVWFYALTFWEHVPACALVTWAAVLALRAHRAASWRDALGAGLLFGLSIWLRDALYLLVAVAAVLVALAPSRRATLAPFAAAVAICVVPLWLFNDAHFGSVLGLHLQPDSPLERGWGPHIDDRGKVLWRLLLTLHERPWASVLVTFPLVVLAARRPALGRESLRYALSGLAIVVAMVPVLVITSLRSRASPLAVLFETNGFFSAAAIVALGFVARRPVGKRTGCEDAERALWLLSVGHIALYVLLSPERLTTGIHWGCRYLTDVVPLLGVLSAVALARMWIAFPRWLGRPLVGAALAMSVALQVYSIALQHDRRVYSARVNAAAARASQRAILTTSWFVPQELAHVFFDKPIFLIPPNANPHVLRRSLLEHGYQSVLFVAEPPPNARQLGIEVIDDGLGFESLGFGAMSTRM